MAALAGLIAVSTAVRYWGATQISGLWIAPDEMIYGALGRSLWHSGELRVFGGPTGIYSLVYPALAGLPLSLSDLELGYELLKPLQALVMSLAAVPVYFWGRRLTTAGWALVAAALTLAVPGLLYAGMIMTEVAFYPVLVLAAWALAAAIERPTLGRQALLVGAIALAVATRLQALVLGVVVVTALVLVALLERDVRRSLRLWPALAGLGALGLAWAVWRIGGAGGISDVLGSYAGAGERPYELGRASRFVLYHVADVLLLTGLFPLCAVALLAWEAVRGREPSSPARIYLAVALSLVAWLVAEVGVFASEYVRRFAERDLIGAAPVLFLGFAVWLGRSGPRPRIAAAAVALVALATVLAVPLRSFVVREALPDAFTLVPLIWLREHASDETLELVVWFGAAVALAAFVLLPRRLLPILPVAVVGALAFASVAATREVAESVSFDQRFLLGGERGWIDRAVDEPVAYLYAGERYWNGVWQQLFWNERIRQVYVLADVVIPPGGLPQKRVRVEPNGRLVLHDGTLVPERLMVTSNAQQLKGTPIASIEQEFLEQSGLTLWRLDPPAQISTILTGVRENGDMHEPGRLLAYGCDGGQLQLTLLPKLSTRVLLRVNGRTVQTLALHGEPYVNAIIDPPAGAEVCRFEVAPDSLLGSTRFEFVRGLN